MKVYKKTRLAVSIGCLQIGGAEVFIVNLLKHIDYTKFEVMLIVLSKKYNSFLETELEILPVKVCYLNKNEGFNPLTMIKIAFIIKRFKPDVLHGNIGGVVYFLLFLLVSSVKCIHTVHTLAEKEFSRFKRGILKKFYRKNKIIPVAISKKVKESIEQNYEIKNVILIENGIDLNEFQYERNYDLETITIGHVGRFEEVKNHLTIVAVYKMLKRIYPNISLKLIGDGSLFKKISQELTSVSNVEIIRLTPNIGEELKDIDVFIFPSIYEGFPLSIIEAMASGAVIVASKVGGIPDLVENERNGYLIDDCFDSEGFFKILDMLINNKGIIKKISQTNIEKSKRYDITIMANKYQDLYLKEAKSVKR